MSLVNILMTRDRAFVATDTLAMQGDSLTVVTRLLGPPVRHPKLLALPHARCVIAWRSNMPEAIDGLRLGLLQDFESFDHGLSDLPERLTINLEAEARRQGYASLSEVEAGSPLLSQNLFMVGWSEGEQCMGLLMLHYQDGKLRRQVAFGPRFGVTHCLSCADGERVQELPADAYAMRALTHAKLARAREVDSLGAKGVGGTLVVAEITQRSVNLTHCGDLGLPPYARVGQDLERRSESMQLQMASVPQVQTEGLAPDAVTQGATTDTGYGIATIASDAAAANRNTYTFKTLSNTVDVTFTGSGSPVILTATGGALELDTESTNSPTVAGFCMELRDGSTPLKTVSTFGNLVSIVGGVANNDAGSHGTYNFLHARGSLSLAHELPGYTGSKTFHLVFGYLLLNASGTPVAPGTVSYKNSLQVSDAILTVKEYKR